MNVDTLATAAPQPATRAAPLVVEIALADGRVPAWLADCLGALEREGVIAVAAHADTVSRERAREGAGAALDAWIASRILPEGESALAPVPWVRPRARGPAALALEWRAGTTEERACPVWSLHFGASGTFYADEHVCGDGVLTIALVEHAGGRERTLAETRTKAAHSLALSRSRAGWKAAGLLERALRRRALGADAGSAPAPAGARTPSAARPVRGILARTLGRVAARGAREDAWQLAWRARSAQDTLPGGTPWRAEHVLAAPRGRFYADPFLLAHAGREALFFEEFDARAGRGHIAAVELGPRGTAGRVQRVLAAPHHLSYPFVFEHDGVAYLIPETSATRRVELWRARAFPFEWELACVLLDGVRAVDTTWCQHDGRFWLFACVARPHAPLSEELCAFWSDRPFGPWRAHALNPIVDDPCGARPAGRLFVDAGRLVRPAQDVSREYGGHIVFQEVLELAPGRYAERALGTLDPAALVQFRGALGVHTFDRSARHEVVDVRRTRWRDPLAWLRRRT